MIFVDRNAELPIVTTFDKSKSMFCNPEFWNAPALIVVTCDWESVTETRLEQRMKQLLGIVVIFVFEKEMDVSDRHESKQ